MSSQNSVTPSVLFLPGAIPEHAEDIAAAGLKATKTGIMFSPRKPIPTDLVERLVRASRKGLGV